MRGPLMAPLDDAPIDERPQPPRERLDGQLRVPTARSGDRGSGLRDVDGRAEGVPEVSVVIPTFRRGAGVRPTLDAVLAQRDVDLEILFVDDHSADGSIDALRATATDGRIRILELELAGLRA